MPVDDADMLQVPTWRLGYPGATELIDLMYMIRPSIPQ